MMGGGGGSLSLWLFERERERERKKEKKIQTSLFDIRSFVCRNSSGQ